jgi:DNA-binding LacI/PurR family transcriptional regulator
MQVTIKDIAAELGISVSTVSRALKDHPDINVETKRKVRELAEKYNYTPNAIALSLRSNKSFNIGVIIPEIVHHFFSSVISGIEGLAWQEGYHVMIYQSNESLEREIQNTRALLSSKVDGVIISMTKDTNQFDHFKELQKSKVPVVFFDRICPEIESDRVIIDDYQASFNAVEHLISGGAKRIFHFAGPQNLQITQQRKTGYLDALRKHSLEIRDEYVFDCDNYDKAILLMTTLIENKNIPDAIFAVNDFTAIGAMTALKKHGIRIPDQIALAGFTNGLISMVTDPPLSTVDQHGYEMGQKAMELLLDRVERKFDGLARTVVIPTEFIPRGSTK